MNRPNNHCGNCRFYQATRGELHGQCRAFPPTVQLVQKPDASHTTHTAWPKVKAVNWCGYWTPEEIEPFERPPLGTKAAWEHAYEVVAEHDADLQQLARRIRETTDEDMLTELWGDVATTALMRRQASEAASHAKEEYERPF